MGYSNSHKAYKCINSHGRIFNLRHVIFNEDRFPFHYGFLNTRGPLKTLIENSYVSLPMCTAGNFNNNDTTPVIEEALLDDTNL